MNDRDTLVRKSRRTKDELDISQYKRKRNEVNISIRKARSSYHKIMLKENSGNKNEYWKSLKTICPIKSATGPLLHSFDIDGVRTNDQSRISNAFCAFFTSHIKIERNCNSFARFCMEEPCSYTSKN